MSIIVQHAFKQYLICMLELFHNCLGINVTETQALASPQIRFQTIAVGSSLQPSEILLRLLYTIHIYREVISRLLQ